MAGPFQVDPNSAREVQQVQQRGGFDTLVPASNNVGAVSDLVTQVATVATQVNKDAAKDKLRAELGSVTKALQASKFPNSPEGDLVTQEGMVNPINRGAINEMQRIVNAGLQGKLPQYAVVERVNVILNDAVSAAPEWREELNGVAREMLGFNPQAELMNQLLAAPRQGPKTEIQKMQEEADALGMPIETLRAIKVQALQAETERLQLGLLKERGEYGAAEAARESYLSAGEVTKTALGFLQQRIKAGQPVNPDEYKAILTNARESMRQRMLSGLGPGVSVSTMNAALDQLDSITNGLMGLADNQDALALLTKHNKTFIAMTEKQVYDIQGLGQVLAIAGPKGMDAVLSALDRYSSNPKALQMFAKSGQPGSGALNLASMFKGMTDSITRMNGGQESTTDEQKKMDLITGQALLQQHGLTGTQAAPVLSFLRKAGKAGNGEDYATVKALSDGKVVSNLSKVKEAQPELINIYNSELARLSAEYDGLSVKGYVPNGGVQVVDGRISPEIQRVERPGPGNSAYNDWTRKMNNLINYGDKYGSTGVFPPSVYAGPQGLAEMLNSRAKPGITNGDGTNTPAPSQAVQYVRDPATGKIVRVQGDQQ